MLRDGHITQALVPGNVQVPPSRPNTPLGAARSTSAQCCLAEAGGSRDTGVLLATSLLLRGSWAPSWHPQSSLALRTLLTVTPSAPAPEGSQSQPLRQAGQESRSSSELPAASKAREEPNSSGAQRPPPWLAQRCRAEEHGAGNHSRAPGGGWFSSHRLWARAGALGSSRGPGRLRCSVQWTGQVGSRERSQTAYLIFLAIQTRVLQLLVLRAVI